MEVVPRNMMATSLTNVYDISKDGGFPHTTGACAQYAQHQTMPKIVELDSCDLPVGPMVTPFVSLILEDPIQDILIDF